MRVALVQMNASDDPTENLDHLLGMLAIAQDADFIVTPEVTNCVSTSRTHQQAVLCRESADPTLAEIKKQALTLGKWILIGSLALKTGDADGRFANRSFLIAPDGKIVARYDKIQMFDVALPGGEKYEESSGYRPGSHAVVCNTPIGAIGMTVCYDLRFPHLYRSLAQSGAQIITVPSAFTRETGRAHWEPLLRARAIETGCFVVAPAQCGLHRSVSGKCRKTYGHSLAIDPWGEVLADGGENPGVIFVDLDLELVDQARHRIPALNHNREFSGPRWTTQTKT